MFDLTHSQKRDFLETMGKAYIKNSEELHTKEIETSLEIKVTSDPEFLEIIYDHCRIYKRTKKIKF